MKKIKLIAADIDGVLLEDTFSPVLRNLVLNYGGEYTREIERNIFSRPREEAAMYLKNRMNLEGNIQELLQEFFKERDSYNEIHPKGLIEGADDFIKMIDSIDVKKIVYGGLPESQVIDEFKEYLPYFDKYICTNDFRPGIKEITKDIYGLDFNEVLFIDDVNTVAETAKELGVAFIGTPAKYEWGWQKKDMMETGVTYMFDGVKEITVDVLKEIDNQIANGVFWK